MLPPEAAPPAGDVNNHPAPAPQASVDLAALATKIYALLKEELRLERERSGLRPSR